MKSTKSNIQKVFIIFNLADKSSIGMENIEYALLFIIYFC